MVLCSLDVRCEVCRELVPIGYEVEQQYKNQVRISACGLIVQLSSSLSRYLATHVTGTNTAVIEKGF